MSQTILEIKDLYASVGETTILKGVNLSIRAGEIHAIMGPNGSGKSTLSKVIAGHPAYSLISGDILFFGQSILEMEPDERAKAGIFLAFQYPVEIPGVSNSDFLRIALNARRKFQGLSEFSPLEFFQLITEKIDLVGMQESFLTRNVNEGFSGGEKKRNEILQMALLDSKISILDETDSGLDIDALRVVAKGINTLAKSTNSIILITHYQRLLDYIIPDFVHIMSNGQIVKTGSVTLAQDLEKHGYDWITQT
uniref:Probable ATP-dependent transporter ycf16 n=1 Tax=Pyropia yezoensis TaxID=2788 RepID=M4QGH3_PYRYE|nr:sulfate ABC transporter protein [Neopyropia yezoensis]QFZ66902.1 sulfate ABC transporter protein [Neopyropia yezoensis]ULU28888.1 sulfate ABC transporter protein [Neopyropia yezoensis]WKD83397.1 iron-sulfur cluster formation ABC transporter ATP-binding subunit [Neopyropia yezoensis]